MANIDIKSILSKAKTYTDSAEFQKKVEQKNDTIITNGGSVNASNGRKVTIKGAQAAAKKFIEVLKSEIDGSDMAISNVISLEYGSPQKVGANKYQIEVWFSNDLHRKSLAPDIYDGVDNIVALFNNGYSAGNTVYGIWHGEQVASLTERTGIHFIESAVRNYMANYASEYGVIDIEIDSAYK